MTTITAMRRKDREMDRTFAEAVIDRCVYAVLATVNEDGSPYAVPLSIVRDGEYIYFHCAKEGRKLDNLRRDSRLSLACVGNVQVPPDQFTVNFESAVVFGRAGEVLDEGEKIHALRLLCERHTPANMAAFDQTIARSLAYTGVWKIHIDALSGKMKKD